MARYCVDRGTICDYADVNEHCMKEFCDRDDIGNCSYKNVEEYASMYGRSCIICGKVTKDYSTPLCDKCIDKLRKVLYNI